MLAEAHVIGGPPRLPDVSRYSPDAANQKTAQIAALLLGRIHTYERVGHDMRSMEFREDGSIGLGSAGREAYWNLTDDNDGVMVLDIFSPTELTCRLRYDEFGVWRGSWLHAEQMPIAVYHAEYLLEEPDDTASNLKIGSTAASLAIKTALGGMFARPYSVEVYGDGGKAFAALRGRKVLIYFRHGFGDFVQFASILPLLSKSNRYWLVRYGDDYTSVFHASEHITPVYLGVHSIHSGDGASYHNADLGMNRSCRDGEVQTLNLPLTLHGLCTREGIDAVLQPTFQEVHGWIPPPFHTKARFTLRQLAQGVDLNEDVFQPLKSALSFEEEPWLLDYVSTRLRNFCGFGNRKLCLISRNGYTHIGKNWGHRWREDLPSGKQHEGEECRDFMRLMLERDPDWLFLTMEDREFRGEDTLKSEALHCYTYFDLFGPATVGALPFGRVLRAIVQLADLAIGVPTGPYHLCMAHPTLPTVGLWFEHMPSWYDEPKERSVHILSSNVKDMRLDLRPGSFSECGGLKFNTIQAGTRIITGRQVMDAVELLLTPRCRLGEGNA